MVIALGDRWKHTIPSVNRSENLRTTLSSGQKLERDGRISIPKIGWVLRISAIVGIVALLAYYLENGLEIQDPLIFFAALMPIQELIIVSIGWFFYRNPSQKDAENDLVSVIIPVFNQESMIATVIKNITESTYRNIEIIAVNDGSKDSTKEVLNEIQEQYPNLKIIHKKNEGKRATNATGFHRAKGDFIVFVDSDSIMDKNAIMEFMKAFKTFPKVGALVGHAKVLNCEKSFFTKFQDAWYDSSFNIVKTTESVLSNVVCCSGCLSAYRREAIESFIPLWKENNKISANRDQKQSPHFKSNPWKNKRLNGFSRKILLWCSRFDDAEDITLTAQTLVDWKTMYVSSAIVYTDVPDNLKDFLRQQTRWKKGWIRAGFFMMTFFWTKNPLISIVFYINMVSSLSLPLILPITYLYAPLVLEQYWIPFLSLAITSLFGIFQGMDYRLRDPTSKTWKYKFLANVVTGFLLPWLIIPALLTMKKDQWMTR